MEEIRAKLMEEMEDVQKELERLEEQLRVRGDYGFGKGDPSVYQWEFNLSLKERYTDHLTQIQEALQRMDQGTYGECKRCRRPIEKERLEVLPFTSLCITCAKESD